MVYYIPMFNLTCEKRTLHTTNQCLPKTNKRKNSYSQVIKIIKV